MNTREVYKKKLEKVLRKRKRRRRKYENRK